MHAKRHGNKLGDPRFGHFPAALHVFFFLEERNPAVFAQRFLNPGRMQIDALVLLQKAFAETNRGTDNKFRGIALAFEQTQHAVTGVEAGGDLQDNFL